MIESNGGGSEVTSDSTTPSSVILSESLASVTTPPTAEDVARLSVHVTTERSSIDVNNNHDTLRAFAEEPMPVQHNVKTPHAQVDKEKNHQASASTNLGTNEVGGHTTRLELTSHDARRKRAPTIAIDMSVKSPTQKHDTSPDQESIDRKGPRGFLSVPGLSEGNILEGDNGPRLANEPSTVHVRPTNDELVLTREPAGSSSVAKTRNRFMNQFRKDAGTEGMAVSRRSNRPPSDESAQTKRKRFLRRFRDDSESPRRQSATRRRSFTVKNQLQGTLLNSWINLFLLFWPAGITLYCVKASPILVFVMNILPLIPLASLLDLAMEELTLQVGSVLGAMINITS